MAFCRMMPRAYTSFRIKMIHTKKDHLGGQKRSNELLVVAKQTVTALGSRLYIARVKVTRSRVRKL